MTAKTIFASLAVVSVAGLGLYNYHPGFRTEVNSILGIIDHDTVTTEESLDTVYYENTVSENYEKDTNKPKKKLKPDRFTVLDQYAKNTPKIHEKDIQTLANYLLLKAKSEEDKARLVFSWIATHVKYDAAGYNSGNYGDCSATAVLKRKTAVCEGYSELFKELGIAMGLKVEKITGYAKGYGYDDGQDFSDVNHAWNVAQIDGKWKLMDVTWGSGYGETKNNKLVSVTKFDPWWFNTAPTEFIFSHLPSDAKWQMAGTQITLGQFAKLPDIGSEFFLLGFSSRQMYTMAVSGKVTEFAEAYPNDFPLTAVQLPFTKHLNRGEKCKFIIKSDYAEEISLIDDETWIPLVKNGTEFSAEYAPKGKKLTIASKVDKGGNWSIFIKYDIKNKTDNIK